ncbi:NAD-dependent protein deacetylase sirtuin-2 [Pelomyxa schiedti]|nr:NAD-dependent protein deacetylase sirtuin-2 [Pelomyxa schiedti]
MAAVTPKTNCPHIPTDDLLLSPVTAIADKLHQGCEECHQCKENWGCLHCGTVQCSRDQNGHMAAHSAKTIFHTCVVSLTDLSFWCYACDSYVTSPELEAVYKTLEARKFPPEKVDGEGLEKMVEGLSISEKPKEEAVIKSFDLAGVAEAIKSGRCRKIIVMTGAGISVSAGIPDFRTPGTGLYYTLERFNLPEPKAIFEISYFQSNPKPFFVLAKELYPGLFKPTKSHYFIRLLHQKGLLLRNFTQNIDTLEVIAGIPDDKLVFAHGSFSTAHCVLCNKAHSVDFVKQTIFADDIPRCSCSGLVKPDIVFFGEGLPERFWKCMDEDFPSCDLLLVIGTSLVVYPFAGLVSQPGDKVPRVLINREKVGRFFHWEDRDVFWAGNCDDGVQALADLLGWGTELQALMDTAPLVDIAKPKPNPEPAPIASPSSTAESSSTSTSTSTATSASSSTSASTVDSSTTPKTTPTTATPDIVSKISAIDAELDASTKPPEPTTPTAPTTPIITPSPSEQAAVTPATTPVEPTKEGVSVAVASKEVPAPVSVPVPVPTTKPEASDVAVTAPVTKDQQEPSQKS